jgi:hypothetical protein
MQYSSDSEEYSRLEKQEREHAEAFAKAINLLQKSPEFPGVQVRIHHREKEIETDASGESKERLSEARFQLCLKLLDVRAEEYLLLVVDRDTHGAFTTVMEYLTRSVFGYFSGMPMEQIPPSSPFSHPEPPHQIIVYALAFLWATSILSP